MRAHLLIREDLFQKNLAATTLKILTGLLFSVALANSCPAEDAVIRLPSPDRIHALIGETEVTRPLAIRNIESGKIEFRFEVTSPILFVQWLKNSESIVIVSHLAGSSVLAIVSRVDHGWKRMDFEPPGIDPARYGVTGLVEKNGLIMVKYRLAWRGSLTVDPRYGTMEFTVEPVIGSISDVVKKEVPLEDFVAMKLLDNR